MKKAAAEKGQRSSGVLLHVTSLPSHFGIGDLGPGAHSWIEALSAAGIRWWQILPLGPSIYGNSPYSSLSAFAGNFILISPEHLFEAGLVSRTELSSSKLPAGMIRYPAVKKAKGKLLNCAWHRFSNNPGQFRAMRVALERFKSEERLWLRDYCLYMAIREEAGGIPWYRWPRELAFHREPAIEQARTRLQSSTDYHSFVQYLFFAQLSELVKKARKEGVRIIGDLPIFVSHDSADVWSNRQLFLLDRQGRLVKQSGVPPDCFSVTGQLWGNPLYRWSTHQQQNFSWWKERVRLLLKYAELIRIDHFRGLEACWAVPGKDKTALRGRWTKVPGKALLDAMRRRFGNPPFLAEDLGTITPEVERLRDRFSLPGMRVLQFAFDSNSDNPHLPCNFPRNCVVYTGTHDNNTSRGWFADLPQSFRRRVEEYLPGAGKNPTRALIREAVSSVADIAIVPFQDLLGAGSDTRMNRPGKAAGNWQWRLREIDQRLLGEFGRLSGLYGRNL